MIALTLRPAVEVRDWVGGVIDKVGTRHSYSGDYGKTPMGQTIGILPKEYAQSMPIFINLFCGRFAEELEQICVTLCYTPGCIRQGPVYRGVFLDR